MDVDSTDQSSSRAAEDGSLRVSGSASEPGFCTQVEHLSGQKLPDCYQCGECTAGCPAAFAMDLMPNQVTRMVQLGLADEVLSSSTIWLCVGCETCSTRCPKNVEIPRIMDALRQIATARGIRSQQREIQLFHQTFMDAIGRSGRMHEMGMIAALKLKTGKLTKDMPLGMQLMRKGKLALRPPTVRNRAAIRKIFEGRQKEAGDE